MVAFDEEGTTEPPPADSYRALLCNGELRGGRNVEGLRPRELPERCYVTLDEPEPAKLEFFFSLYAFINKTRNVLLFTLRFSQGHRIVFCFS